VEEVIKGDVGRPLEKPFQSPGQEEGRPAAPSQGKIFLPFMLTPPGDTKIFPYPFSLGKSDFIYSWRAVEMKVKGKGA